jgi:hypothetical protein
MKEIRRRGQETFPPVVTVLSGVGRVARRFYSLFVESKF